MRSKTGRSEKTRNRSSTAPPAPSGACNFYRMTTYAAHPDGVAMSVAGGPTDSPSLGRYRDSSDFPEIT
jgi:hypothetical protein